jgi:Glycosyltransferases involved in cell wall biogenesis
MSKLISVIIPVFNGARFLHAAIQSVLQQDYRPIEIVVVDDGSTDGSSAIAKSFPEVRYYYQENRGVGAARNLALRHVTGDFLAFLDQDDQWLPQKLSKQVAYLQQNPGRDYILTHQRLHYLSEDVDPTWLRKEFWQKDHPGLHLGTLLARRSFFDEVGMFDTSFVYGSDGDWLFRAKRRQSLQFLDEVLLLKGVHDSNESHKVPQVQKELLRILKKSIDQSREGVGKDKA